MFHWRFRWYHWLDRKLSAIDPGLNGILIAIAVISLLMTLAPRPVKAGWVVYLLSP